MSTYGNTIDETIGLTVAGTEILTGQAGKVSRGLRSVGAELVKLANDSGEFTYQVNGTTKALSLFDEQGKMLSTFDALEKIYQDWDKMNEAEQSSLALTLGMKTQIDVLSAVFNNFDSAINATNTAMNSQGSAMEENSKYMLSLEARISLLRAEFEKLVLGDGGLSSLLKNLVDTGTAILKFANSDIGQLTIKLIALVGTLALLSKGFTLLKTKMNITVTIMAMSTAIKALIFGIQALIVGAGTLTEVIGYLTAAMKINPLFIGATLAIGAIVGITKLIDHFTVSVEEASEAMSEYSQEYETATSKVKSLEDELETIDDKVKEINLQDGAKIARDGELAILIAQRAELERQLKIQIALADEAKREAEESAKKVLANVSVGKGEVSESGEIVYETETKVQKLQDITDAIKILKDEQIELNTQFNNGSITVKELTNQSAELDKEISDLTSKGNGYAKTLGDATKNLTSTDEATVALKESTNDVLDPYLEIVGATESFNDILEDNEEVIGESGKTLEEWAEILGKSEDEIESQADAVGLTIDQFGIYSEEAQKIIDKTDEINNSIDGLQNALSVAQKAQKEYNETGAVSLDTFQQLLSISPDYLSALINEDGQIKINESSLFNLTEQLKQTKIQELQAAMTADILALANGNAGKMSDTAKGAIAGLGDSASKAGDQAADAAAQIVSLAASVALLAKARVSLTDDGTGAEDLDKQVKAITDAYSNIEKKISGIGVSLGSGSGGGGGKGGGGGSRGKSSEELAKEATKTYKEEYDKQVKDLKHKLAMDTISEEKYYENLKNLTEQYFGEASGYHDEFIDEYQKVEEELYDWQKKQKEKEADLYKMAMDHIQKTLDDQLDDLKDQRDEELEYLDERIDKIEEKKDAELKSIKVTIDALKEEEKAFKKNIDSQIDSLEELQDKEEEEWDAKIEAFKEQNKVLQDQIELQKLQEALAKAKSTKVKIFQNGKFVYGTDESAVSSAEEAIQDYYDQRKQEDELKSLEDARDAALENYQKQIDDLKKYKESMSEQYEKRIEDMEKHYDDTEYRYDLTIEQMQKHRDEVEAEYDEQIEDMEDYIQEFEDMTNEYEDEQNRLALIQLEGAEAESKNWANRLDNLKNFVDEYNKLQKELNEDHIGGVGNGLGSAIKDVADVVAGIGSGSKPNKPNNSNKPSGPASDPDLIGRRSSGDSSIKKDGIYQVGESPNSELVIGSKLNHNSGVLSHLSSGDGVINAKSTNTIAGLMNSLGNLSNPALNNSRNNSTTIKIDNINLPQVTNGEEFVDYLKGFSTRMTQNSY